MIDYLAIGVTHLLLILAAMRLLSRGDLDHEVEPASTAPAEPVIAPVPPAAPSTGQGGVARLPRMGGGRRA